MSLTDWHHRDPRLVLMIVLSHQKGVHCHGVKPRQIIMDGLLKCRSCSIFNCLLCLFYICVYVCLMWWDVVHHQRVGRLSMQGWRGRAIYAAILKPYNSTTNVQNAYLSIQASSLSAFVISKTHVSGQKPRGRQLNAKVCDGKSALFSS